jgi:CRP-like cAMP-binding protein
MAVINYNEIIRSSPLAVELNDEQSLILSKLVEVKNLGDGDILIREGEISNELYVILTGNLAVTRESGNGDFITLHVLRQRDLAGELGFLDGLEHSATLQAIGPTEVFCLRRDRLESLLDSHPKIVYFVMRAIFREIHGILRRMNMQQVELTNYIRKQHGRY